MRTLLRIDCSARSEGSHSRALAGHFQAAWTRANSDGKVVLRDLGHHPPPHLDQTAILALGAAPGASPDAALSDELIREFQSADDVVISSPIYNLGPPSPLKAYIDHIVRSGHTFSFEESGATGLLSETNAYLLTSRGGTDSEGGDDDFLTPYLRAILGYIGIFNTETIALDGTASDADEVARRVAQARVAIDRLFVPCGPLWVGPFTDDDRSEIDALRNAQAQAISNGDARRYSELCDEDVRLMIPGHDIIAGRERFLAVEEKLLARGQFRTFEKCPERIERQGDFAVEVGRQRVSAAAVEHNGVLTPEQKYTHIFRRTARGWRFAVLMSNSSN